MSTSLPSLPLPPPNPILLFLIKYWGPPTTHVTTTHLPPTPPLIITNHYLSHYSHHSLFHHHPSFPSPPFPSPPIISIPSTIHSQTEKQHIDLDSKPLKDVSLPLCPAASCRFCPPVPYVTLYPWYLVVIGGRPWSRSWFPWRVARGSREEWALTAYL